MKREDIRWEQRFENYKNALKKLEDAVIYIKAHFSKGTDALYGDSADETLDDLIKQGLVQSFEYTHELAWNVMKDYISFQGIENVHGSRDATRESFSLGVISDGETWMEMIKSRNKTSHTYDEETANDIFYSI